jgi:hypothetical protein
MVHVTVDDVSGSAKYREQPVEVALGPKGAFENGNIGRLTRRVHAGQVVSAVPERQRRARRPKPRREPPDATRGRDVAQGYQVAAAT